MRETVRRSYETFYFQSIIDILYVPNCSQLRLPNMNVFGSESPIWAFMLFSFCVINIQFLPGIAAVITRRLGNSDGEHTAQQKVPVLRHKQALSITLLRKSSGLCRKSLSLNENWKCPSTSVGGEDHLWTRWEIISVTSWRQHRPVKETAISLLNAQIYKHHRGATAVEVSVANVKSGQNPACDS